MAEGSGGEKTEKATAHKRQEQRKEGNVMQSRDVVSAASVIVLFFVLRITAQLMYRTITEDMSYWMEIAGHGMDDNGTKIDGMEIATKLIIEIGKTVLISAGPLLVISMIIPVIATGVQTRFIFCTKSFQFKIDKLNPLNGIKRMFSLSGLFELAKSILKLIILGAIVYDEIKGRIGEMARLLQYDVGVGLVYIADVVFAICMKLAVVFVAVAAVDFMYQKYKWEKDMMMTKQEVKEEYKMMEGDPQIKGKRRQKQQQMAYARMMQDVPEADVVIRNPTHFAVAIKYDENKDRAPIVIAKGADKVAFRIIDKAAEHNVKIVENVPLARGL
ncbi:MAG: EscU/YscU/HrcU family type III secretion system export apparatus switch protein, partial [Oscillospiraceae bacterium]|nr:EscU/YscU/HrcU family type III secretion system export apparatus switch protein [Oscillospiraceae bacterium]